MNKYILLSFLMILFGNIVVWFQVNGQLIWKTFQNNTLLLCLSGIPITYIFIKATQWGYQGFGEKLWPFRISGMAIGVIVFSLMTAFFMHEVPSPKTLVTLTLCVLAILIQMFL